MSVCAYVDVILYYCMHVCICLDESVSVCVCVHAYVHARVCMRVCACMCVRVCPCVRARVCVCLCMHHICAGLGEPGLSAGSLALLARENKQHAVLQVGR